MSEHEREREKSLTRAGLSRAKVCAEESAALMPRLKASIFMQLDWLAKRNIAQVNLEMCLKTKQ